MERIEDLQKLDIRRGREGGEYSRRVDPIYLTVKEIAFIDEYMIDRNGSAAARRAGFGRPKQAAHRLLMMQSVQQEIDRRTAERSARVGITYDDVVDELHRIATFDIRTLFDADGKPRQDIHNFTEDEARALAGFDVIVLNRQGDYVVRLNPASRMRALELLGKSLDMFVDKVEKSEARQVTYSLDFGGNENS